MGNTKLDSYDKKLIYSLDENSRYSLGQLSKLVRLSKNAIHHRIQNLIKKGIITQFYSLINSRSLGYSYFKVYFKLQSTDEPSEKAFISYLTNKLPTLWIASWEGEYNLSAGILAKNPEELYIYLKDISNKYQNIIKSYDIFIVLSAPHFHRNYLLENLPKKQIKIEKFEANQKNIQIDEIDKILLKEISTNSRIPITEIAEKTKTSIDIVRYRLKKLTEQGIIQGNRVSFNYSLLGYQVYKVLITTQNLTEEAERKIISYCSSKNNFSDLIIHGIGKWGIELQIDAQNLQDFHKIFKEFKNNFNDIIKDYTTLSMLQEYKLNYFPF